jgi:hypothetical protein
VTKSTDGRLPFEPKKKSKKSDSDSDVKATNSPNNGAKSSASEKLNQPVKPSPKAAVKTSAPKPANGPKNNAADGIPTEVSQRMVRRASLFCGIPTSLSFVVFLGSYFVTVNHIFTLPNAVVVSASFLCFGLGVVGLTYGALSASWDEGRIGGFWGWQECTKNFGYLRSAWQEQKALNQAQALKAKAAAKQAAIKKITAPPTDQKTSSN